MLLRLTTVTLLSCVNSLNLIVVYSITTFVFNQATTPAANLVNNRKKDIDEEI